MNLMWIGIIIILLTFFLMTISSLKDVQSTLEENKLLIDKLQQKELELKAKEDSSINESKIILIEGDNNHVK